VDCRVWILTIEYVLGLEFRVLSLRSSVPLSLCGNQHHPSGIQYTAEGIKNKNSSPIYYDLKKKTTFAPPKKLNTYG
jgi:hypothetical protein